MPAAAAAETSASPAASVVTPTRRLLLLLLPWPYKSACSVVGPNRLAHDDNDEDDDDDVAAVVVAAAAVWPTIACRLILPAFLWVLPAKVAVVKFELLLLWLEILELLFCKWQTKAEWKTH